MYNEGLTTAAIVTPAYLSRLIIPCSFPVDKIVYNWQIARVEGQKR